eukprot:CAMPEP_0171985000 /NCGR_PEP_ID=MMETSP0993-20121228/274120_1 /TAXON_ID=483369 /ORGANISM="non described non described, Strain CCMP2098" /LENGTH=441 /DNA_ID=CAMNT_0012637843 /DNA_START=186 /DNA_END=1512 /DNA_ORIENTATION=+
MSAVFAHASSHPPTSPTPSLPEAEAPQSSTMMPLLLNKILVPSSHRKPLDPSWFADASGGKRAMFVMAPMVGQSDLPFRLLARRHGATVVFGEMMLADRFAADPGYRLQAFGNAPLRREDHPLVAQFAANTPEAFVGAALEAQKLGCDAVDLNLGCPQRRAKEHHYGSFMTDPCDWALCCAIVHQAAVHPELCLPITVKIRLQPTLEATVQFARLLAASGASMVSVHGRQRGRENQRRDGSANLDWVAAVVRALEPFGVPVVANGNVRCPRDVTANLASTGAAGIMVAEEILRDPAVFSRSRWELTSTGGGVDGAKAATDPCSPPPSGKDLADEYIHLLEGLDRGCFHHPPCSPPPSGKDLADEYIHLLEGLDRGCFHHPMKRLEQKLGGYAWRMGQVSEKKAQKALGDFLQVPRLALQITMRKEKANLSGYRCGGRMQRS